MPNLHPIQEYYVDLIHNKNIGCPLPTGIGATIIMLESIKRMNTPVLIVAPKMLHNTISIECDNYFKNFKVISISGPYRQLRLQSAYSKDPKFIYVINEESLKWLFNNTLQFEALPWKVLFTRCIKTNNKHSKTSKLLNCLFSKMDKIFNLTYNPLLFNG